MSKDYIVLCKGKMIYEFAEYYEKQVAEDVASSMAKIWPHLTFHVVQKISMWESTVLTDDHVDYKVWNGKGKFPWDR